MPAVLLLTSLWLALAAEPEVRQPIAMAFDDRGRDR